MRIVIGETSYVSLTDATAYVTTNYVSKDAKKVGWLALSDSDKEIFLKKATKKIDRQKIRGIKATLTQPLEFPRAISSDYNRAEYYQNITISNYTGYVVEKEVTQIVKDAEVEEALALMIDGNMSNKRAELQAQGVKSFSLGNLSESYVASSNQTETKLLSIEANDLLTYYLLGAVQIK